MDIFEADMTMSFVRVNGLALLGFGIDFRNGIDQLDDIRTGTPGGRDVGHEGENVSGLDGTKGCALISWLVLDRRRNELQNTP